LGFTTGVSQPSDVKCAAFENAEELGSGAAELDADGDEDEDDEEEEDDVDDDDEESVMRQRSANGR